MVMAEVVLDPPDGGTRGILAQRTGVNADGGDCESHTNGGGELRTLAFQTVAVPDKVFAVIVEQSVRLAQLRKRDIHRLLRRLIAPNTVRKDLLPGSKLPQRFFDDFSVNFGSGNDRLPSGEEAKMFRAGANGENLSGRVKRSFKQVDWHRHSKPRRVGLFPAPSHSTITGQFAASAGCLGPVRAG